MSKAPQNSISDWPLVSIVIPVYNGLKFLPVCLPSVVAMDYPNTEIICLDDASSDGSAEYIEKNYASIRVIRQPHNVGFAATLNNGFWMSKGKYLFFVNQDTVYAGDYLKICVEKMEHEPRLAAITGKVYKYDFEQHKRSHIIDSVGLIILKNRRVLDEGQGEEDRGQFERAGEIFGISGQNPLYRRAALKEVAVPIPGRSRPELLDEDFFMYKEEVDLAWRLRLFGWKAWYEPAANAWHGRATSAVKRTNNLEILRHRRKLSQFQKYHSIKNRYLMMAKNELCSLYWWHFPRIFWNDLLYFGYNLFFNTASVKAYFMALTLIPRMLVKRRWIMKNRQVGPREMKYWFKSK